MKDDTLDFLEQIGTETEPKPQQLKCEMPIEVGISVCGAEPVWKVNGRYFVCDRHKHTLEDMQRALNSQGVYFTFRPL